MSCPFSLAITPDVSRKALISVLGSSASSALDIWSERELICSYLCLHWILGDARYVRESYFWISAGDSCVVRSHRDVLAHEPYLDTLPSADKLRTPLHFTHEELEAFRGSNLYGATHDRRRAWQEECNQCREAFAAVNPAWASEFTW